MTTDGKLYPLIPFDLVIDTEVGLLQTIAKKYHNTDTFYESLLDAPVKYQIYLLNYRKRINPITAIAKERDNDELMDDYYRQFMEENHWIPHRSERRVLIENLYRQIYRKGLMIYRGEVNRIVDYRMRKWNRRYLEREMEKARQVIQNGNETAE